MIWTPLQSDRPDWEQELITLSLPIKTSHKKLNLSMAQLTDQTCRALKSSPVSSRLFKRISRMPKTIFKEETSLQKAGADLPKRKFMLSNHQLRMSFCCSENHLSRTKWKNHLLVKTHYWNLRSSRHKQKLWLAKIKTTSSKSSLMTKMIKKWKHSWPKKSITWKRLENK